MEKYILFLFLACVICTAAAQPADNKASFDAMEACIRTGDVTALSAWFPNTLECNLLGEESAYSKAQATMVLKNFFEQHPPAKFAFKHSSDKQTVKYAIGILQTKNNDILRVTILIKDQNKELKIQQLRIERE
ncbi:MAG: DUF4783 domain-containing protein [Prevotellaceae bacterium]|jgi:hypothetical protein|nr:DUF4783 domain-containing protein [Prevotellaceae bacterium]